MFDLSGVEVRYTADGGERPIRVAQWSAARGEHWALVGPSGSGKSSLLHVLAGLLRPRAGSVTVAGQDLAPLDGARLDRWRGRTVGLVPQRLHLLRSLTVLENVLLAPFLAGVEGDRTRAAALLAALGLGDKATRKPDELSQGEAQRVAIARAVINSPVVLLADEPTASLDDAHCGAALEVLIGQARAVGATLVVATHDHRVRRAIANVREMAAA
jgi:putative ABC transport system ATP-binding protein